MNRVNGSSLKTVRDFLGKNQSYMAKQMGISQPSLSKIERGEKPLEREHIEIFSKYFTETFFYNNIETANPKLFYRKLASINKSTIYLFESRINLIHNMISRALEIVDLTTEGQKVPQIDPEIFNLDFEYIATEVRLQLGIGRGPITNVIAILEAAGVIVHFFDYDFISAENRKFDGVSFYVDGIPVIMINKKIPNSRKMFTIAHELGHLVMHFDNVINYERDIEKEANHFAAAFLAPAKDIKTDLRQLTMDKLERLKLEWNMSLSALVYRAFTLKTIGDQSLRTWMMRLAPFRKSEPYEFEIGKPSLMSDLISSLKVETNDNFFSELGYNNSLIEELFNEVRDKTRSVLRIVR